MFSQYSGVVPRYRASRSAVSPEIGTPARDDSVDTVRRNVNGGRQLIHVEAAVADALFQYLSGVNRSKAHSCLICREGSEDR